MNKKEKIKKWFKEHFTKEKIIPWVLTGLIMLIVLLCVYFENRDKKNMESKTSDISLVETDANLNKAWSINQDGNLVGNNLINESSLTDNMAIDGSNGVPFAYNGYRASEFFIGVSPNTEYSKTINIQIYFYDNNKTYIPNTLISYNESPFTTPNNAYFIRIECNSLNGQIMLNIGDTLLSWEPYGVWYSESNYDNYGNIRYNNGRASVENQFYYFNDKTIYYYADESLYQDRLVGYQYLEQNSFTNFTINATDIIEPFYNEYEVDFYYGKITLNILSSEFYANFIYPVSTIDGYVKIIYADGTSYNVESYSLNREYHIYDGSITNPEKYITDIYIQFEYDALLSVDITTSVNAVYYNNGYNEGYDKGYTNGNVDGLQVGRTNGYNEGYEVGYNNGINQDITTSGFKTLFNSILSYPINLISSVFNFEFMGINIASTIFFLISCGIVLWIIKRLWK